jgi:hypothetical protein
MQCSQQAGLRYMQLFMCASKRQQRWGGARHLRSPDSLFVPLCRCETCQRCLDNFTATASMDGTTEVLATTFRTACVDKGRPSANCDRAEKAIRASFNGNLGRRVGAICRVLGECDAGLATNATCVLTGDGKSGQLSECLRGGVSNGTAIPGIGKCRVWQNSCFLQTFKISLSSSMEACAGHMQLVLQTKCLTFAC